MSSLLAIALASVKLSSGTLKSMYLKNASFCHPERSEGARYFKVLKKFNFAAQDHDPTNNYLLSL